MCFNRRTSDIVIVCVSIARYADAQKVLNRARKAVPTDRSIWITAARLEETVGKQENVEKLIQTGVKSLRNNGVEINREEWIKEAEKAEQTGNIATSEAIIRTILGEVQAFCPPICLPIQPIQPTHFVFLWDRFTSRCVLACYYVS